MDCEQCGACEVWGVYSVGCVKCGLCTVGCEYITLCYTARGRPKACQKVASCTAPHLCVTLCSCLTASLLMGLAVPYTERVERASQQ